MSTMQDAEDAILAGQARFLAWLEEFVQQWDAPLADTLAGVNWAAQGEATRQAQREMLPGAAGRLDQMTGLTGGANARQQSQVGPTTGPAPTPF